ncbi:sex hormone-binding globulin [Betta splendens]|uniref:Sex hormone-binding globulin n=1 Tax=Betta splendens TaxID=158456 RepID=A0A6P7KKN8_BETSP|nr:sex hormone-binding globulin [Betta splendens]
MSVLCKVMASVLVLTLSLAALGWGDGDQGNGRSEKEVSGQSTVYLGQDRDTWRPLMHTTVKLSDIKGIKSSFQMRTFDPEGVIFYGDTKSGEDWFVLSLKGGAPLMQIRKLNVVVSAAGGPKLNDGKWHTLEVSNQGKFVILEVDGSDGLVVGMHSDVTEDDLSGDLRLALGGILISKEKLLVPLGPQMDACVRKGNWLNLSIPWKSEVPDLWPCYQNIQPGSYFPGNGFAIYNTSVFHVEEGHSVKIELWGDFDQMDGTILSIKAPGQKPALVLVANNKTQELTVTDNEKLVVMKDSLKRLEIMLKADSPQDEDKEKESAFVMSGGTLSVQLGHSSAWKDGRLAIGGLLGENTGESKGNAGSQFLTGCLEKIQVQGRDLDLDLAVKHKSVSPHSCPA